MSGPAVPQRPTPARPSGRCGGRDGRSADLSTLPVHVDLADHLPVTDQECDLVLGTLGDLIGHLLRDTT